MEEGFVAWETRDTNIVDDVSAAHHDINTWLMRNGTRQDAERLLANTPTGTFLIRRREAGHYALSITCNSTTNHCLIYETDKGYGFALPYNIYESLLGLVLHYAQNSLEEHNDALTTTLKYPVYSEFTMRYKQQQQIQKKSQTPQQIIAPSNDQHKAQNQDETTNQVSSFTIEASTEQDTVDGQISSSALTIMTTATITESSSSSSSSSTTSTTENTITSSSQSSLSPSSTTTTTTASNTSNNLQYTHENSLYALNNQNFKSFDRNSS